MLLKDGPATYQAMFAAIHMAADHINLESYIFDDDEVGRRFADVLLEKQAQGVQVNLIYDSVGAFNTPRSFFDRLTEGKIRVLEFNPLNPLTAKKKWLLNNRDHRKLLVVDGHTAFIGGINISSVYSSGSGARHAQKHGAEKPAVWRDTHIRIEGPVVRQFQRLFLDTWEKQHGGPLAAKDYYPDIENRGAEVVRAIGSAASDPYSAMYITLLSAIHHAQDHVYLTNAYFVPKPRLLKALTAAAQRGVDVKLILPSITDFWAVFHAGRSHYSRLLKAGVKIYERRNAILHSKTALIDGIWSCIGSTNLDWRSLTHNNEIDAVIVGETFAGHMQTMFTQDLLESDIIIRKDWERRSLRLRLKEWTARLWEYWL